jgi:dTDP-4-dehydrorhamnose 3,5-epimerase
VRFTPLALPGAFLVELEPIADERGFFARAWCAQEFAERGLNHQLVQCNISYNAYQGTLRGMHWQDAPHGEAKLVRCTRGAVYDVLVDLRRESPTFKRWVGMELDAHGRQALYIPERMAHGFQTLTPDSEIFYQMSIIHHPGSARGLPWNDPALAITWPDPHTPVISAKDRGWPSYPW